MLCGRCGQENPEGFAFCGSCGAALDGDEGGQQQRKTVTENDIEFGNVS